MKSLFQAALAILFLTCALQASAQQDRGAWQPDSHTASSITGPIAISENRLSINFLGFTIVPLRALKPEEVAAVFDADVNTAGPGTLYHLNVAAEQRFLHKNTLCGSEATQWMATYAYGKTLRVAFFSSSEPPQFTFDAISNSTTLCGTYTYTR